MPDEHRERMYFCLDAYLEERPNSGTIHYVPNSSKGAYMSIKRKRAATESPPPAALGPQPAPLS
jgi:hypothetical protein